MNIPLPKKPVKYYDAYDLSEYIIEDANGDYFLIDYEKIGDREWNWKFVNRKIDNRYWIFIGDTVFHQAVVLSEEDFNNISKAQKLPKLKKNNIEILKLDWNAIDEDVRKYSKNKENKS